MPEKHTGKEIAKRWGLNVQQALYRKTGDWYHQLTKFPGALLDSDGYIIFESEEAFRACSQLRIGKNPRRHGGWVSAPLGIKAIPGYVENHRSFIEFVVRPRAPAKGQAWNATAVERRAIEEYAMELAIRHYASLWREVHDVSATEPFDLLCRDGDRELRVEVKGTTSLGCSVLLTRNEVWHAEANSGRVALFVVSNVVVNTSGCTGGSVRVLEPWYIRQDQLEPIAFEYRLHAWRDRRNQSRSRVGATDI
jgi:hypothetical protein